MKPEIVLNKNPVATIDQKATAAVARKHRTDNHVLITHIAEEMDLSPAQVSFLENGKRSWTVDSFDAYVAAVNKLKPQPQAA